jgi:hypothetical protein
MTKSRTLIFFLFFLIPLFLSGQEMDSLPGPPPAKNALFLEIGGSFVWLGGFSYEHTAIRKQDFLLSFRTGLGINIWENDRTAVAIPIGASLNFGKLHYLETGLNGALQVWASQVSASENADVTYQWHSSLGFQPLIGYRFQSSTPGSILFRVNITTLPFSVCLNEDAFLSCPDSSFSLWMGMSIGFLF